MLLSPPRRLAALALAGVLLGCGGPRKEASPAEPPQAVETPAAGSEEAAAPPDGAESASAEPGKAPAYTPFGIPECDAFLVKFRKCVEERIPADQRGKVENELRENRTRWWKLADMQNGKIAVGLACRMFAQSKKGDLQVDFGCEF